MKRADHRTNTLSCLPFILIQRYNTPRLTKLMEKTIIETGETTYKTARSIYANT